MLKKTKIFIWRLFKRCLLTRKELVRRHIQEEAACPLCGIEAESETHVLLKCEWVKQVWYNRGPQVTSDSSLADLSDWPWFLIDYQPTGRLEHVFIIAWTTWFHRNHVVHDQDGFNIHDIIWQDERALNDAATWKISGLARMEAIWVPSLFGWMKFNTDATMGNNGWVA